MNQKDILYRAAEAVNQQTHTVPVQPVPMSFKIAQAQMPDGRMSIVLSVSTPVGEAVYFLEADQAKTIGETLQKAASAASSGLMLVTN